MEPSLSGLDDLFLYEKVLGFMIIDTCWKYLILINNFM